MAQKGTIFLDEIGDIPITLQTKLLRILQEKEFERIGGYNTIKVDVRVITATNRNLEILMEEGKFREDLFYRLNVFPIIVPPLRERKTDIMLLANYFIEKYSSEHCKEISGVSTSATDMLMNYHWPGNVRELENCIERAIILSNDGIIHSYILPVNMQNMQHHNGDKSNSTGNYFKDTLAGLERGIIIEELKRSRGNMAEAARSLGITERMIGIRVAKYGIDHVEFK